jgi:hypothetical protein
MKRRRIHAWTTDEEARFVELVERGFYLRRIALRLRRSESSIKQRAKILGLEVKKTPRGSFSVDAKTMSA